MDPRLRGHGHIDMRRSRAWISLRDACHPRVSLAHQWSSTHLGHEDVLGFDVPVEDLPLVQVLQRKQKLHKEAHDDLL